MQNASVILTKNSVLQKMGGLLQQVADRQQMAVAAGLTKDTMLFLNGPKISKGENYLGLPYLILDYPRYGARTDLFFIRSMFWWGNFFSSTLHVAGSFRPEAATRAAASKDTLEQHYIGVNTDQWVHHFEGSNFRPIEGMDGAEYARACRNGDHLKLGIRWPLQQWEAAPELLYQNWVQMLELCGLVA